MGACGETFESVFGHGCLLEGIVSFKCREAKCLDHSKIILASFCAAIHSVHHEYTESLKTAL